MIESISKPKIPQKYSYILKTKQLEDVLIKNNIDIHIDLQYSIPGIIGTIFEVHFWSPNPNCPYNRLYIRAGVLPKEDAYNARIKMVEIVLPKFDSWIINRLSPTPKSDPQMKWNYFNAEYKDGDIYINDVKI